MAKVLKIYDKIYYYTEMVSQGRFGLFWRDLRQVLSAEGFLMRWSRGMLEPIDRSKEKCIVCPYPVLRRGLHTKDRNETGNLRAVCELFILLRR